MLHKAEEWKLIRSARKIKLLKEYGQCRPQKVRPHMKRFNCRERC
jgi:hypothetical protein